MKRNRARVGHRPRSNRIWLLVAAGLASLSACGGPGAAQGPDGGDAAAVATDAAPAAGSPDGEAPGRRYRFVAIFDGNGTPACATGFGPGADIDAVALRRGGAPIGFGLKGSARLAPSPVFGAGAACSLCGMPPGTCINAVESFAGRAEGAPDGRISAGVPDQGFISLNTAVLWLEIGSVTGDGPAQELLPGDNLQVYEVDGYYLDVGIARSCLCPPDRYEVRAYPERDLASDGVALVPVSYRPENAGYCGTTPTGADGCGTTLFVVP